MRRKYPYSVYLTTEQEEALRDLKTLTKIPTSEVIREGINLAIAKHLRRLLNDEEVERRERAKQIVIALSGLDEVAP